MASLDKAHSNDDLENITLRQLLRVSDEALDQAMGIAYQLYLNRRFAETEILCRRLVACDHRYWWSRSLHASALRRLGRHEEALAQVEIGLKYEPRQPKLMLMRDELRLTIARKSAPKGPQPRSLPCLDVQVADVERVGFDENPPGLDQIAHQRGKQAVRLVSVFDPNL